MKSYGFALLAVFAVGCTTTSSPVVPTTATPPAQGQDLKPDTSVRKVTIYFWSDDDPTDGNWKLHLGGLNPVTLSWSGGGTLGSTGPLTANKQGAVSAEVPKSATQLFWETGDWAASPTGPFYCADSGGPIPLPYGLRQNWVLLHSDPVNCP
jgi:hypothetical protein